MARTKASFPGFPKEALQFLRSIEKNNNRAWFGKMKSVYENSVKAPMLALVEALDQELLDYAPEYITEPSKAVFRIHRDVRFAKNKDPYKTNIAAGFHRQNLGKNDTASFYLHLDAKGIFVGAGVYMPIPEHIRMLRNHIAANHIEFREILADNQLRKWMGELHGELMIRPPKGFIAGHPAQDLLIRKMYFMAATLPTDLALTPQLLGEVSARFRASTPLVEFLNRPIPEPTRRMKDDHFAE